MEVLIGKIMEHFVLPPGSLLLLLLIGMLLRRRFYRTGQTCIYSAIALLVLLSMPLVSGLLNATLETYPALTEIPSSGLNARAIVILGGGRNADAPEYGGKDTVSIYALERCRYGAHLQRKTRLPILVTGGTVHKNGRVPEGELMKEVLEKDFISVVHWVEGRSRTTYENAIYSFELLNKENIHDIILVTQAYHMPRAVEAFEHAGFHVTPAPMGFSSASTAPLYFQVLPSMGALGRSHTIIHEWVGRLWYHLRYY